MMRNLGRDHPETFTQGYNTRVDSVAINAAPRRIEQFLGQDTHNNKQTYHKLNVSKTDFVAGVSATTMGGRDSQFSSTVIQSRAAVGRTRFWAFLSYIYILVYISHLRTRKEQIPLRAMRTFEALASYTRFPSGTFQGEWRKNRMFAKTCF